MSLMTSWKKGKESWYCCGNSDSVVIVVVVVVCIRRMHC
jgi:hypothetical protein